MLLHDKPDLSEKPSEHIRPLALSPGQVLRVDARPFTIAIAILAGAITHEHEGSVRITSMGHVLVVPPGTDLSVTARGACDVRILETDRRFGGDIHALRLSPLLYAIAQHDAVPATVRDMHALFLSEMCRSDLANPEVRLPADPRARWIAQAIIDDPADPRSLANFAEESGTARRTLLRLFVTQTGLNFRQYRQHVRIYRSLALLAEDASVQDVALTVGYESAQAFIAAFRKVMGASPGQHRKRRRHV
ncbi:AraC family transcriptional regulator [Sphingomonas sp. H39-1-10]|uniref:helix-turn-helix domain-containing protein n=1 Tax=Sphingomonas pollutisoli TaxID=3030829 RepID=UPI0023B9FFA6|nr:AraC family transcriptional regulator [Sphingomonas pollutisoli]MDF0487877.1 AraC family transcriptional regulator [Sphingomonas pollutisoli]